MIICAAISSTGIAKKKVAPGGRGKTLMEANRKSSPPHAPIMELMRKIREGQPVRAVGLDDLGQPPR